MIKALKSTTALACMAAPAATQAADFATISCIESQVPPIIGKRFGDAVISEARATVSGTPAPPASLDAEIDTISDIAAKCQAQYGWSDAALEGAIGYSVPRMGMSGVRALLADSKADPATVERAHRNLLLHHRVAFALSDVPDEAVAALMDGLKREGMAEPSQEVGVYLGVLAGLLALAEVELDRFVKN